MRNSLNREQIIIYLDDLRDIREEHTKSVQKCIECDKFGYCVFLSTLNVEIVTFERGLSEITTFEQKLAESI